MASADILFEPSPTVAELRALAALRERYSQIYEDLEIGMPSAGGSERPDAYRRRLLAPLQRHSSDWLRADLTRLPTDAVDRIEPLIVADASAVASDPTVGSFKRRGQMRELHRVDQSGAETVTFHGSPNAWMQTFMAPAKACVTAFNDRRR